MNGDTVGVHYIGKLFDGTIFDSPYDKGIPFEFPLGKGRLIKGWDEGIASLRLGEKAVFIIPSELAFGAQGSGKIPPYASLVFEVELVSISY